MPRIWIRKTQRERPTENVIAEAINKILTEASIRSVSEYCKISKSALARHVSSAKSLEAGETYTYKPNTKVRQVFSYILNDPQPSTSHALNDETITPETIIIKPEDVRLYPKSKPRVASRKGRKRGTTRILTDTPEKDELEVNSKRNVVKMKQSKMKLCLDADSSSSDLDKPQLKDSSDDENFEPGEEDCDFLNLDQTSLSVGDFVAVKFPTTKTTVYYVGKILAEERDGLWEITFLRRKGNDFIYFVYPDIGDKSVVMKDDFVFKLPEPHRVASTKRNSRDIYSFNVNIKSKFSKLS